MSRVTRIALIAGAGAVLVLVAVRWFFWGGDGISRAAAGDCVDAAQVVDCSSAGARFKVLAVLPAAGSCADVAGAVSFTAAGSRRVCLGPVGADPAKAVNVAKEGDCVDLDPAEPQRVACDSPDADHRVLRRLTNVPSAQTDGACREVAGADKSYGWDLQGTDDGATVDVVLCFGPLQR
ncbi:LppU/SCO3897 family protein [Dactylosporangium sp. CA-092794]|uniref:LppU/SCO3897 family protein n=1 Tax=Dactylosporangium sp. CA-092794 TaxID=3239929 RepID=UPI003D9181D7